MGRGQRRWVLGASCAALLLCACGDDDDAPPDGGGGRPDGGASDGGRTGLGDGVAGKACTSNAQCSGGRCATELAGIGLTGTLNAAPGGYCTATCMVDAECGAGGACVLTIGATVAGECFATCTTADDCRDGYECGGGLSFAGVTVPNTCRPPPQTDQLDDGVAGATCSTVDDCPGGMCLTARTGLTGSTALPGGYCSGRCLTDAHCGEGGVCLPPLLGGAGSCYQACADDSECTREGYRCRVLGVGSGLRGCNPFADPLPDNTSGKACTSDADCGGTAGTCLSELPASGFIGAFGQTVPAPGGYCSQACAENSDCGEGGVCTGGVLGGGYCYRPCASAAECRAGYVCEERGIGGAAGAGAPAPPDAGTADGGATSPSTVCAPEPVASEDDAGAG